MVTTKMNLDITKGEFMKRLISIMFLTGCSLSLLFAAGAKEQEITSGPKGVVTIYTPHGPEITDPILDAFNEKYPDVRIEQIKAGTGELFSRLEAEQSNPSADVMWGGDTTSFESYESLFASYESPADEFMQNTDPAHKWHPFAILCQPILVNTNLLSEDEYPTTVKDLVNLKWKGKAIALADPNKSGTGYTIVSGLVNAYGWDFIEQMLENSVVIPGSDAMFKAVRDGELPAGFINEDLGATWEAEGLPVKMIYAEDAVTVQMDAIALVKNGPNPELGKLLIDFVSSPEAHKIAVDTISRRSARIDVDPPEVLPKLGKLNLFTANEPRQIVNAKFDALLK